MEQGEEPTVKVEEKDDCQDLVNERDSLDPSYENALRLLNAGKLLFSFFDYKTRVDYLKDRVANVSKLRFNNGVLINIVHQVCVHF